MDAYFTSDDRTHSLASGAHTYLKLHVPTGLYLLVAKAHVATSMGYPVPPATEASLNAAALLRLKVGDSIADQAYATVTGQWDVGINHQVVTLMAAEQVEEAVSLEAGSIYPSPGISQMRLTALPLGQILSGQGIEFKRETAEAAHLLHSMVAAGLFPQP